MILKNTWRSFLYALNGLKTVWKEERNFRIEIIVTIFVLALTYYFKFSFIETSIVILAITAVLMSEIINTAIEDLCNKVEPGHDSEIGKIKDTMAGFTLVSAIGSVILGVLVFIHHF